MCLIVPIARGEAPSWEDMRARLAEILQDAPTCEMPSSPISVFKSQVVRARLGGSSEALLIGSACWREVGGGALVLGPCG